jgi:hypothetical protein
VIEQVKETTDFPINIALHQGLALRTYLFALTMDEVTRDIQGGIPWCTLFADDVFWWMRVGRGLTRSWSCGDELWRQNVLGLVGLKRST